MNRDTMIATASATVVTVIVTGTLGLAFGAFEKGSAAVAEDAIERIVDARLADTMTTDSGMTHAQALAAINQSLTRIETKVEGVEDDIDDIRDVVRALAQ